MTILARKSTTSVPHVLSFDVEEHYQVSAFWCQRRRSKWDELESRVDKNTRRIVDLLAQSDAKATFFVLGWVAERHPDLVKYLVGTGHEVASHGYGHELVTTQSPEEFRKDVRKAKAILEDLTGKRIAGYRAPSFSIAAGTEWALSILAEENYLYDSSVYHRFRKKYRGPRTTSHCYKIDTLSGPIWEVSPSTLRTCGVYIPVAGGGYFRLMPYPILKLFLKRLENEGLQLVMYLHPWEIDPEQPRMKGPLLSRVRHYMNLKKTEERLQLLLEDFQFGSIAEVLEPIRKALHGGEGQCVRLSSEPLNGHSHSEIHSGDRQEGGLAPL